VLDAHRLRIFRSVVASGSIQAAADHLGYTASAVSQQVAALQRETGLALIERSGRGIVPTAAGHALAAESAEVIAGLTRLGGVVADLREGRTGRLTVGYFASAGSVWMPQMVRALMDEFPHLLLELTLNEIPEETPTRQPDIDLIIESVHERPAVPGGYRRVHLADDPYVVIVHESHPAAGRHRLPLGELAEDVWVDNDYANAPCRRIMMNACDAAGFAPRYAVQAQDHHTAIAFVAEGIGVTVVPRLAAANLPATVRAVRLTGPEPMRRISLLVRRSVMNSPPAARATTVLTEYAALVHHDRPI
jgi:DNA-binding transcriptional LysR family regulator